MSYRSRLYNHRNAQSPEGGKKKPFFSSKHGAGAAATDDKKKFFHAGGAGAPQVQRLATSPIDEKMGTTEEKQARNKGDKLRLGHGEGRGGGVPDAPMAGDRNKVQRDLALEPGNAAAAEPKLTREQIHDAILFNNARYGPNSVREIQKIVGAPVTGVMNKETVDRVAYYQSLYHLVADGKAGVDTFGQLTDEMTAEKKSPEHCITYFLVTVADELETHPAPARNGVDQARIFGKFDVEIRFDPHCDCSQLEYRQYISGDAFQNNQNINRFFTSVPGGHLPGAGNWRWDGDRNLNNNGHYGVRGAAANQGGVTDEYTDATGAPDAAGCNYRASDDPGLRSVDVARGDRFVFDIRFHGEIIRKSDKKVMEDKFWAVRGEARIP
jgi:hypothetical protein